MVNSRPFYRQACQEAVQIRLEACHILILRLQNGAGGTGKDLLSQEILQGAAAAIL